MNENIKLENIKKMKHLKSLKKTLGPGILFASTAIGVSHLVQSTKAGALFGFGLLWAVIAANILKYPFFEFGSRYANATGKSIIDGTDKTLGIFQRGRDFSISMYCQVMRIGVYISKRGLRKSN